MDSMIPERCRKNVRRVMNAMSVDECTAYSMLMMTALLMDLYPEDENVAAMILRDNGMPEAV